MSNDWKSFIVTTHYVTDLEGTDYSYQIPPTWKTELLVWDLLEKAPGTKCESLHSVLEAFDSICQVVAMLLGVPKDKNVEDLFDSGSIEQVFTNIWESISNAIPENLIKAAKSATQQPPQEDFSLAQALAMFAVECGWLPEQVLNLPKIQVITLTSSISDYVSQSMKFQASIHGIPLDGSGSDSYSSGTTDPTQINIEDELRQFQSAGLPVEVI